jgi:PII-like signaling protein
MPFDPNLPADAANVKAAELRGQFNGLFDLIEPGPAGPQGLQGRRALRASRVRRVIRAGWRGRKVIRGSRGFKARRAIRDRPVRSVCKASPVVKLVRKVRRARKVFPARRAMPARRRWAARSARRGDGGAIERGDLRYRAESHEHRAFPRQL